MKKRSGIIHDLYTARITMTASKETTNIAMLRIDQLVESELNVRKGTPNKADDAALKANISAVGLLQNLVALPVTDDGLYPIIVGGRRLKQLKILLKEKVFTSEDTFAVKLLSKNDSEKFATEVSLSENYIRSDMHAVDAYHSFSKMIHQGATLAEVANSFSVTQKFVKQRMKLSTVLPEVLEAFRTGDITLETVMCYSIADTEQQKIVWENFKVRKNFNVSTLRDALKPDALEEKNYLVQYVGKDAYKKAGGLTTSDMFKDTVFFDDAQLIRKMATAKLEKEAIKLKKEGWKWCNVQLKSGYFDTNGFQKLEFSEENGEKTYLKSEVALAGCLVALRENGEVILHRGLVAKDDLAALKALQFGGGTEQETVEKTEKIKGYSVALKDDLIAQRLIISKYELLSNPDLAIKTLHFSICLDAFDQNYNRPPVSIRHSETSHTPSKGALEDNKALDLIDKAEKQLKLDWLKIKKPAKRFDAFCLLDDKEIQKQVAFATAISLEPSLAEGREEIECVIEKLNIKWSEYWRPNADTFFKRISLEELVEIGANVMDEQWQLQAASLKRKDAALMVDGLVNGEGGQLSKAQTDFFNQWMPKGF